MMEICEKAIVNIGIDVSKEKLDVFDCISKKHQVINNSEKSIGAFIKKLKTQEYEYRIIMEYTGGYEKVAHKTFAKAGLFVHVAPPISVHNFAKDQGSFAKTDKIDATILATYGEQKTLSSTPLPTKDEEELKELSTRRGQLVEQLTAEKCRLKPHLTRPMKRSIERTIKWITKEIELIEIEIDKRIDGDEDKKKLRKRLMSFKGIGRACANGLICNLPELGQLNRAEIACLLGVAPKNKDSGIRRGKRIVCGGRFYVRRLMYMAALVSVRHNKRMKAFYESLKAAGKPSKVALTAVMRKIIITLNAMVQNETDWNECYISMKSK